MTDTARMEAGNDPADFTVTQVNDYLNTLTGTDDPEYQRVLAAESEGQARKGIIGDGDAPEQGDANGTADTTTKGATFAEAAAAYNEQNALGYFGTSPERERTGAADKGLSQQSPGILDGSSPAPDARPQVDDSEAIERLKG
jgi:hypothetical protein